jgi:hydrogenase nickel incorporation protein HypA/HybF
MTPLGPDTMHELQITAELIDIIKEHATKAGARSVRTVKLKVGALTGFFPIPIVHYYDLLKKDEPLLASSVLDAEVVPGTVTCNRCGAHSTCDDFITLCQACGSADTQRTGGDAVLIQSLEIDDEGD